MIVKGLIKSPRLSFTSRFSEHNCVPLSKWKKNAGMLEYNIGHHKIFLASLFRVDNDLLITTPSDTPTIY